MESGLYPFKWSEGRLWNSFQNRGRFLVWFSSGFCLQYQFYYTHRQYFDSFGNFRVFSIPIGQLYAYSRFWVWEIGSLIWVRFSSKHQNTATYTQEDLKWPTPYYRHMVAVSLKHIQGKINFKEKSLHCLSSSEIAQISQSSRFIKMLIKPCTIKCTHLCNFTCIHCSDNIFCIRPVL
jgi:hypothetical protein